MGFRFSLYKDFDNLCNIQPKQFLQVRLFKVELQEKIHPRAQGFGNKAYGHQGAVGPGIHAGRRVQHVELTVTWACVEPTVSLITNLFYFRLTWLPYFT